MAHCEATATETIMSPTSSHCEVCDKKMQVLINSKRSAFISTEKYGKIVNHLKCPEIVVDSNFRHWVKKKQYYLLDLPAIGLKDVLFIPNKDSAERGLRVLHSDQMFEVCYMVHSNEVNHSGYKKTWDTLQRTYSGISRAYVETFIKHCPVCQLKQPQTVKPKLKPIVEKEWLARVQLDLIDMRKSPDGPYKWICHFMDHFTKYHIVYPLRSKEADEVATMFRERVLAYVGPPKMFHLFNGIIDQ